MNPLPFRFTWLLGLVRWLSHVILPCGIKRSARTMYLSSVIFGALTDEVDRLLTT